mgnify:CR=1 FL=1
MYAQPLEPLPPLPVSLPGKPTPAYCVVHSNQPLSPLELSTFDPGNAIHTPATPEELAICIS